MEGASRSNNAGKTEKGDWLQRIIDRLACEYGWSKEQIFNLYPKEVEMLIAIANERRAQEDDIRIYNMAVSACVPHMKDGGKQFFRDLLSKYKRYDDGGDVTPESIARDNELAKRVLGM